MRQTRGNRAPPTQEADLKAIQIQEFGGPEVMEVVELPDPEPEPEPLNPDDPEPVLPLPEDCENPSGVTDKAVKAQMSAARRRERRREFV